MSYKKLIATLSLAVATLLLAGCNNSAMMMEQEKMMMDMRSSIDEAMRMANSADYKASQAKDMAGEAMSMMHKMMMKKEV